MDAVILGAAILLAIRLAARRMGGGSGGGWAAPISAGFAAFLIGAMFAANPVAGVSRPVALAVAGGLGLAAGMVLLALGRVIRHVLSRSASDKT